MTALKFVKIAERGWVNDSTYTEGYWATDELIANNGTWYAIALVCDRSASLIRL